MSRGNLVFRARTSIYWAGALAFIAAFAPRGSAAFHLWSIHEIYSNSNGKLQFIELMDGPPYDFSGFQNSVNGLSISVMNTGNTQTNTFMIPGSSLPGNTLNHMLLFGTAGIQAAGGPAPDYIIPDNFLFTAGGSVSFFGANGGAYGPMPTDGTSSVDWDSHNIGLNSPTNYAGQTGTVNPLPEPSTMVLTLTVAATGGVARWRSRRRAANPDSAA
jgi:hypothetical protein